MTAPLTVSISASASAPKPLADTASANAVGMALGKKLLAAEFDRPGHTVVDHRTCVLVGDGCLIERIAHEACSLAGTLGPGKLIAFYDEHGVSIDGACQGWFTALAAEGVAARCVSLPCTSLFDCQHALYRDAMRLRGVPPIAVEAGVTDCGRTYVGPDGAVVSIDTFGESAPAAALFTHFAFAVDNVASAVRRDPAQRYH